MGDICGIEREPSEGACRERARDHALRLRNDYGGVSLGDTVTFNVDPWWHSSPQARKGSMSAGTMTHASWGQCKGRRARSWRRKPLNSSMGVLEADIDGGIFHQEVTKTEGAHLHRRGASTTVRF